MAQTFDDPSAASPQVESASSTEHLRLLFEELTAVDAASRAPIVSSVPSSSLADHSAPSGPIKPAVLSPPAIDIEDEEIAALRRHYMTPMVDRPFYTAPRNPWAHFVKTQRNGPWKCFETLTALGLLNSQCRDWKAPWILPGIPGPETMEAILFKTGKFAVPNPKKRPLGRAFPLIDQDSGRPYKKPRHN